MQGGALFGLDHHCVVHSCSSSQKVGQKIMFFLFFFVLFFILQTADHSHSHVYYRESIYHWRIRVSAKVDTFAFFMFVCHVTQTTLSVMALCQFLVHFHPLFSVTPTLPKTFVCSWSSFSVESFIIFNVTLCLWAVTSQLVFLLLCYIYFSVQLFLAIKFYGASQSYSTV